LLPLAVSVSADGPDHCIIEVGSDTPHQLALYIGLLDVDFEILDPPDLAEAFIRLAKRYQRAVKGSGK
ncbi:MAG TPA: DNA-binding transcriptional regulator, partial [Propionibacteriaceae bacterium]|nr:DNA-binding transcriptional regulator [Propionibacteriaceae bacterium]